MAQHPPPATNPGAAATGRELERGGGREAPRRRRNPSGGRRLGRHGWLDRGSGSREVVGIIFLPFFPSRVLWARSPSAHRRKRFLECVKNCEMVVVGDFVL
jgi:hypothetical protein